MNDIVVNRNNKKRKKHGFLFEPFDGTQKFVEFMNNKFLANYLIWTQVGNKSFFKILDPKLKKVNIEKNKSDKKINHLVVKTHEVYKEMKMDMNWDDEIAFTEAAKTTRFGFFYWLAIDRRRNSVWFTSKEHESYFSSKSNLFKDYKESYFGKFWITAIDRKEIFSFVNNEEEKTPSECIEYFNAETNKIVKELNNQTQIFISFTKRETLLRLEIRKIGLKLEIFNKSIFVDVEQIINRIQKKYNFGEFQITLIKFKLYDFIYTIYFCLHNLFDNIPIVLSYESENECVDVISRTIGNYLNKSIADLIHTFKEFKHVRKIENINKFLFNLELIDNEYIQKIGKIICNLFENKK